MQNVRRPHRGVRLPAYRAHLARHAVQRHLSRLLSGTFARAFVFAGMLASVVVTPIAAQGGPPIPLPVPAPQASVPAGSSTNPTPTPPPSGASAALSSSGNPGGAQVGQADPASRLGAVPPALRADAAGHRNVVVTTTAAFLFAGSVQYRTRFPVSLWQDLPAGVGLPIEPGTSVRTGANGYALIAFSDGSSVSLDPSTEVTLTLDSEQLMYEQLAEAIVRRSAAGIGTGRDAVARSEATIVGWATGAIAPPVDFDVDDGDELSPEEARAEAEAAEAIRNSGTHRAPTLEQLRADAIIEQRIGPSTSSSAAAVGAPAVPLRPQGAPDPLGPDAFQGTQMALSVTRGTVWARIEFQVNETSRYALDTPDADVSTRGATLLVTVDENGETAVHTTTGVVSVSAQEQTAYVAADQYSIVQRGAPPTTPTQTPAPARALRLTLSTRDQLFVCDQHARCAGMQPMSFVPLQVQVNQIPGAFYSGLTKSPHELIIPEPAGTYTVVLGLGLPPALGTGSAAPPASTPGATLGPRTSTYLLEAAAITNGAVTGRDVLRDQLATFERQETTFAIAATTTSSGSSGLDVTRFTTPYRIDSLAELRAGSLLGDVPGVRILSERSLHQFIQAANVLSQDLTGRPLAGAKVSATRAVDLGNGFAQTYLVFPDGIEAPDGAPWDIDDARRAAGELLNGGEIIIPAFCVFGICVENPFEESPADVLDALGNALVSIARVAIPIAEALIPFGPSIHSAIDAIKTSILNPGDAGDAWLKLAEDFPADIQDEVLGAALEKACRPCAVTYDLYQGTNATIELVNAERERLGANSPEPGPRLSPSTVIQTLRDLDYKTRGAESLVSGYRKMLAEPFSLLSPDEAEMALAFLPNIDGNLIQSGLVMYPQFGDAVVQDIKPWERARQLAELPPEARMERFASLPLAVQVTVLTTLPASQRADFIRYMPGQSAIDLLARLPREFQDSTMAKLPELLREALVEPVKASTRIWLIDAQAQARSGLGSGESIEQLVTRMEKARPPESTNIMWRLSAMNLAAQARDAKVAPQQAIVYQGLQDLAAAKAELAKQTAAEVARKESENRLRSMSRTELEDWVADQAAQSIRAKTLAGTLGKSICLQCEIQAANVRLAALRIPPVSVPFANMNEMTNFAFAAADETRPLPNVREPATFVFTPVPLPTRAVPPTQTPFVAPTFTASLTPSITPTFTASATRTPRATPTPQPNNSGGGGTSDATPTPSASQTPGGSVTVSPSTTTGAGATNTPTVAPTVGPLVCMPTCIYFVEVVTGQFAEQRIMRASLSGGPAQLLFTLPYNGSPATLAVDAVAGKLYAAFSYRVQSAIIQADLNGANVTQIFTNFTGDERPAGIAVDGVNGYLYWSVTPNGGIIRANTDGTDPSVFVSGRTFAWQIALDVPGDKLYWVTNSDIQRASLLDPDTDVETLTSGQFGLGVALDGQGQLFGTFYQQVIRASTTGTDRTVILPGILSPELSGVQPAHRQALPHGQQVRRHCGAQGS